MSLSLCCAAPFMGLPLSPQPPCAVSPPWSDYSEALSAVAGSSSTSRCTTDPFLVPLDPQARHMPQQTAFLPMPPAPTVVYVLPPASFNPPSVCSDYEYEPFSSSTLSTCFVGSLDRVHCVVHGKARSAQNMVLLRHRRTMEVKWFCKPECPCKVRGGHKHHHSNNNNKKSDAIKAEASQHFPPIWMSGAAPPSSTGFAYY